MRSATRTTSFLCYLSFGIFEFLRLSQPLQLLDISVSRVECAKEKKMQTETEMSRWRGFGQSWERIQACSMDRGQWRMSLKPCVSLHSHCWGVWQQDARSLKAAGGCPVADCTVASWQGSREKQEFPEGIAEEARMFFFSFVATDAWEVEATLAALLAVWMNGGGEVESRSRSSLFLQSPLIPCYPEHSSLICNPGEGKEYLSHLPNSLNLPPSAPRGNSIFLLLL